LTRALRGAAVALAVAAWLAVGGYGLKSYASHYYTYRGFSPPRDPPGVAPGHVREVKFFSPALGQTRKYLIYLPAGYGAPSTTPKRYPVLYLLHGAPGHPRLFLNAGHFGVALDTLVARHAIRPMLVVMPDGSDGTFRSDTEWANTRHGHYENFVLDTVRAVDATWHTLPYRRDRAIAGLSEGAFAAVNVALHHLATFGVAESWSGYFEASRGGAFKHASPQTRRHNSPTSYVAALAPRLHRLRLRAFIYTGDRDHQRAQVERFVAQLRAAGGHVSFALYPGKHSWKLWRTQGPHMLRFTDRSFGPRA